MERTVHPPVFSIDQYLVDNPSDGVLDDDFESEVEVTRGGPVHDTAAMMQNRGVPIGIRPQPGLVALKDHLIQNFGGSNNGILCVREIRGGGSMSMHSWGMALDWHYGKDADAAEAVAAWAAEHAAVLGIQEVHHYVPGKIWDNRNGKWRAAKPTSADFYEATSRWLHIERNWTSAQDPTPIAQLLGAAGVTPEAPRQLKADTAPPPTSTESVLPQINLGRVATARVVASGPEVTLIQDLLRFTGFATFSESSGTFDEATETAVKAAQTAFVQLGLYNDKVDGIWGKKTSAAAEAYLARGGK